MQSIEMVRNSPVLGWRSATSVAGGFSFASLATFAAMSSGWASTSTLFGWTALALGLITSLVGLSVDRGRSYWISFYIASLTLATLIGAKYLATNSASPHAAELLTVSALLVIPNVISVLIAYRIHPAWYLPIVVGVGAANAVIQNTVWWGLAIAVLMASLLLTTNFLVQLFFDHAWEIEQWKKEGSIGKASSVLARSTVPWLLAGGLAATGTYYYQKAQDAVKFEFYASGAVRQDPNAVDLDLKRDIKYTLGNSQDQDESLVYAKIATGAQSAESAYKNAPKLVSDSIQNYRPPSIRDSPCDEIHWSVKWIVGGLCKALFSSMNSLIINTFESIHQDTVGYVTERTSELNAKNSKTTQDLQRISNEAVRWEYAGYDSAVDYAFAYLRIVNWISLVYVVGALLALFQWFACRVAFDGRGPTFRLSGREEGDEPLDCQVRKKLMLSDYPHSVWYIAKKGINVKGDGLAEMNWPPQPHRCLLGRLRAGHFFMSKATLNGAEVASPPQLSVESPKALVVIALRKGQRVVFRLRDLGGFSDGVLLRSNYSVHTATDFLQLKRFYTSAQGPGHLVLLGSGEVAVMDEGAKASPADLLAWDVRAKFSLDQASTGMGMWINDPRLHIRTSQRSAVAQSAEEHGTLISCKIWRLIRFVAISW